MPLSRCWIITDGAAGNERQALALANALGVSSARRWRLRPRAPWRWLAPRQLPGSSASLPAADASDWSPPWPDLAIGCGRAGAHFTRLLRRQSRGRTHCVQILDPRVDPRHWDVVVAPAHDRVRGANVITTLGSLHAIDQTWLADARSRWPTLGELPGPRTTVLVGGPRRGARGDEDGLRHLLAAARTHARREQGSLLLLASPRTPAIWKARLAEASEGLPGVLWSGPGHGDNPYAGALAWADRVMVSADSVNMLSEACALGRPVLAPSPGPGAGRLTAFHAALHERGVLHPLDHVALLSQPPLRELAGVAAQVRDRLQGLST
jgi:uncharacterized protein